jgi:hypothetical protein
MNRALDRAKQPDGRLVIPLDIGSTVKPWGKIVSVLFTGGERYYLMQGRNGGAISLMPWSTVEAPTIERNKV